MFKFIINDATIEANINMMNHNGVDQEDHKKALLKNIGLIYNQVVEIIKCFDKNKPRLAKYTQDYETLINSWNIFTQETSPKLLGIKLQEVKDNTVNLVDKNE